MSTRIGFVGVGRMGANMARRLKECGRNITVVADAHSETAAKLARELSCEACADLPRVTDRADVIFTVVSNDAAMDAIFAEGDSSLLANAQDRVFVNCATVAPPTHQRIASRARRVGAHVLEACMASSIPQARQGTLYLMCAGPREVYDRVEPILKQLSSAMRYTGATGEAAKLKALVNMVMNINTCALAEGLGLGAAMGLDLDLVREVFAQTGAASQVLKTDGEDMQNRDHECYFSAEHAAKDSRIAHELAVEQELNLPLAKATREQYERMVELGLGQLDKSGIAELTFKGRHA